MILLILCSELSWQLDIEPNAHNIGLLAVQTSTPRNADCVLPPLKTPASDYNPYFTAAAAAGHPQMWHYQRNETEENEQLEAHTNRFKPQPHVWSGGDDEKNHTPDDITLRQVDVDGNEDDNAQYLYVDHEGHEHFAHAEGYDVDGQIQYTEEYTGPMKHEHQNHMFACAQQLQQNKYGQMFSEHQWNQQMYELEQQDVTDVGQLQTADSRNYYTDNGQIQCPYSDDRRAVNTVGQHQWSAAATFAHVVSSAAQPDAASSVFDENNMISTWPRMNVAPSRDVSDSSPTMTASKGDGDFGGYRVQYRQQGRDQFHTVSAAGDGCQKVTVEQADAQTAVPKTVAERLQQAFLHSGNWSLQFCSQG